jgi:DNA-binding transcriptional regulator YbjK
VPALLNQLASFPENMDDFLDTYIQVHLEHERKRLASIRPSTNERAQAWISTIDNAPRSIEAIQTLMDTKEVEMNKVSNVAELQRLDREWSVLEWLQCTIRQAQKEEQQHLLQSK